MIEVDDSCQNETCRIDFAAVKPSETNEEDLEGDSEEEDFDKEDSENEFV